MAKLGVSMKALGEFEVWLVTGSQHLYGETVLGRSPSIRGRWPSR